MTRGASLRHARIGVGASVVALALLAMAAPMVRYEDVLGDRGAAARWALTAAVIAEADAIAAEPAYEIRRRFRAKVAECLGVTATTWPLRLSEMPGRLDLRHGEEPAPALSIDIAALKAGGITGAYARRAPDSAAPSRVVDAVLTTGLIGVFVPDHACPPPRER